MVCVDVKYHVYLLIYLPAFRYIRDTTSVHCNLVTLATPTNWVSIHALARFLTGQFDRLSGSATNFDYFPFCHSAFFAALADRENGAKDYSDHGRAKAGRNTLRSRLSTAVSGQTGTWCICKAKTDMLRSQLSTAVSR